MTWRSGISLLVELWWIGVALSLLAVAGILLVDGCRFVWREVRYWRVRREWRRMQTDHTRRIQLDAIVRRIR